MDHDAKEPGRNDPCPCGSGKKYKRCCLEADKARSTEDAHNTLARAMNPNQPGDVVDARYGLRGPDLWLRVRNKGFDLALWLRRKMGLSG